MPQDQQQLLVAPGLLEEVVEPDVVDRADRGVLVGVAVSTIRLDSG